MAYQVKTVVPWAWKYYIRRREEDRRQDSPEQLYNWVRSQEEQQRRQRPRQARERVSQEERRLGGTSIGGLDGVSWCLEGLIADKLEFNRFCIIFLLQEQILGIYPWLFFGALLNGFLLHSFSTRYFITRRTFTTYLEKRTIRPKLSYLSLTSRGVRSIFGDPGPFVHSIE